MSDDGTAAPASEISTSWPAVALAVEQCGGLTGDPAPVLQFPAYGAVAVREARALAETERIVGEMLELLPPFPVPKYRTAEQWCAWLKAEGFIDPDNYGWIYGVDS